MPETKITTKTNLEAAFAELREANPLFDLENRTLLNGVEYKVFKSAPKTMRDLLEAIPLLHGDFPVLLDKLGKIKSIKRKGRMALSFINYSGDIHVR